ncbi:DUF6274 family protein [Streptomyces sp. NPDC057543]|uniref:DUF6274 family protein n=1 Tax=Streptomyces sp. NPDC057543 TaxID=3346163 RepID=UPI0036AA5A18
MPASTGHEIRALLRARPAAAPGLRHLARRRPVHQRLLRLAMGPVAASRARPPSKPPVRRVRRQEGASGIRDESPSTGRPRVRQPASRGWQPRASARLVTV